MPEQIAVAMSGGVDSSVAALLLQEQGARLLGLTMRLFSPQDLAPGRREGCKALGDVSDAREVAARLSIPHQVLDLSGPFRSQVLERFAAGYESGLTPNPCVDCNRHIKFGALLREAAALGYPNLATGHYVRRCWDSGSGRWLLKMAVHPEKDQSYVLYSLTQDQLARSRFPLGELSKGEIRAIALAHGLVSARKRDSQDICFVPDGDYPAFLRHFRGRGYPPGPFLDREGRVLGAHQGIVNYTVGQRRGLGVSSNRGRLYVNQVRPADNAVVLSDNQALFSRSLTAKGLNLIPMDRLDAPIRVQARIRYNQAGQDATLEQIGPDTVRVTFRQPQRAVSPGQAVVFYDGDVLLGGATILQGEEETP